MDLEEDEEMKELFIVDQIKTKKIFTIFQHYKKEEIDQEEFYMKLKKETRVLINDNQRYNQSDHNQEIREPIDNKTDFLKKKYSHEIDPFEEDEYIGRNLSNLRPQIHH